MNLEHGTVDNTKVYRWCDSNNIPSSEWFNDISLALEWIITYDRTRNTTIL